MLCNHLTIAFRNFLRNRTYSMLMLLGLAGGMTSVILLGLYIKDELSYDRYHKNADRIVRVNLHIKWGENEYKLGMASAPIGPALQQDYPEVKNVLRVKAGSETFLRTGKKALYAKDIIYADSTLFTFFDYTFIEGNPKTAFANPRSIVLTQKLALSLFGSTNGLLGKVVTVKEDFPFVVGAVIKDAPANHHLKFTAILPCSDEKISGIDVSKWDSFNSMVYLMLNQASDRQRLEGKMTAFYRKYIADKIGDDGNAKVKFAITFQPLADMHLQSNHLMGEENGGNMAYVYTFSAIGMFILLIAMVNYINLATAQAAGRAKEIGIRKAIGSSQFQLVGQFLTEAIILSFLALFASLLFVFILLPFFNAVSDKALSLNLGDVRTIASFLGFALLIGFVSGLYPAIILSHFKPAAVLKGKYTASKKGVLLRKSLVVLQFSISTIMIVGTLIVYWQLQYMRHKQLGFSKEQVLAVMLKSPSVQQKANVLKSKLLQSGVIKGVTLTNGSIGGGLNSKTTFSFYTNGTEQSVSTEYFAVDHDFLNVLQIGLKEGRNFSPDLSSDSSGAVLVNEAMLKRLGWKNRTTGSIEFDTKKIQITGVIHDFHLRSLHNKIEPLVLVLKQNRADQMLVRVSPQNISAALVHVGKAFGEVNPAQPFEYTFLDQTFANQYRSDERKSGLFLAFSGIAIFIACLGLFGLATFTTQQRTKEIGVRKILGASIGQIVMLLSKDFLKLVFIAFVIATPVAWYMMNRWLQDFAYRIDISWWVFAIAGLLALLIALVTVSFQAVKAALANPVKSLRSE